MTIPSMLSAIVVVKKVLAIDDVGSVDVIAVVGQHAHDVALPAGRLPDLAALGQERDQRLNHPVRRARIRRAPCERSCCRPGSLFPSEYLM